MLTLSLRDSVLFDIFCSVVVHRIYNRYEVNPANLSLTFLLLFVVPTFPCYFLIANVHSAFLAVVVSYTLFCCSLVLSIVLYRLSPLHPLANYPGPFLLKVSKFVGMYHAASGKQHILFKTLHDKHGPFVRTGPNELSIVEGEAIPSVLEMRKGPMWEVHTAPGTPADISALRNIDEHVERRKLWNYAFTTVSLKEYQPIVGMRISELVQELGRRASDGLEKEEKPLDLAQWMTAFAYDTAGEVVWGEGFGLMSNGAEGGVRTMIEGHAESMSLLHHTPWIIGLVHKLAVVPEGVRKFFEFTSSQYERRRRQGAARKDIFHFITSEGSENGGVSKAQGINDVLLAILAGTDTTSTVLSGVFYYLVSNRDVLDRLKEEVDSEFPGGEVPYDAVRLAKMPYLNAVINEALRLQPAAPTGIQRSVSGGSRGKLCVGRFIPEETAVYVPPYVLHRDPRYFSPDTDKFIPDRWLDTSSGKFTTNASAFIPFSSGYANCVGKNLAWMEMRMAVATIVQKFDMDFAEGYDPRKWEEDLQDFFSVKVGQLPVVLRARE